MQARQLQVEQTCTAEVKLGRSMLASNVRVRARGAIGSGCTTLLLLFMAPFAAPLPAVCLAFCLITSSRDMSRRVSMADIAAAITHRRCVQARSSSPRLAPNRERLRAGRKRDPGVVLLVQVWEAIPVSTVLSLRYVIYLSQQSRRAVRPADVVPCPVRSKFVGESVEHLEPVSS